MAQYECDVGYGLKEAVKRVCQSDGEWSGSDPVCLGMNNKVKFTCMMWKTFHILSNVYATIVLCYHKIKCFCSLSQLNVNSSQNAVDCGEEMLEIDKFNGSVTVPGTVEGCEVTYTCNDGCSSIRICESGKWTGTLPNCPGIHAQCYYY